MLGTFNLCMLTIISESGSSGTDANLLAPREPDAQFTEAGNNNTAEIQYTPSTPTYQPPRPSASPTMDTQYTTKAFGKPFKHFLFSFNLSFLLKYS